jgi:hypothetical protein
MVLLDTFATQIKQINFLRPTKIEILQINVRHVQTSTLSCSSDRKETTVETTTNFECKPK